MSSKSQRVSPLLLDARIDACFYRQEFVSNASRLNASGLKQIQLSELVYAGRRAVYFQTSTLESNRAPHDWVPFLSSDDLGDEGFFLSFDTRKRVSPQFADEYQNGLLRNNEIIVKVKGPNQTTAYCENAPDNRILLSGTLWGALVRTDLVDPHYLVVALSSSYASIARTRLRTNLNVEFLSPTDLLDLKLPVPQKSLSQQYIGDKVRQAERLRAVASESEMAFRKSVLEEFPAVNECATGNVRHYRARPQDLNGDLNPGSFNPDRVKVRAYLKANGGRKLSSFAKIETPTSSTYAFNDRYIGLDSLGSATGTIKPSTVGQEDVVGTVRLLAEGPVISKLRPYLNKVAYIPSELAGSCGSTELLCVRSESAEVNWYLCGVLSLTSTVRQLVPVSTGSTHPRVTREDVLDVLIPWIKSPELAGKKLALAQRAYFMSDRLVALAKLFVEALIERKVAEDDFIHAQTRLDLGDDSADRAILSRLYEGGWDATETRPLFPDLDAYYETIRMVEREQVEVAAK